MDYYLAKNRAEVLTYATTWMSYKVIILSGNSWYKRTYVDPFMLNIQKRQL